MRCQNLKNTVCLTKLGLALVHCIIATLFFTKSPQAQATSAAQPTQSSPTLKAPPLPPIKVRISQSASHFALEATTNGVIEALTQAGYKQGATLDVQVESAQGSAVMASQIASKFTQHMPDLIFTIGTISTLSFLKPLKTSKINVVFATVTDPIASGIVPDPKARTAAITGVSNFVPILPQIQLIKRIQPTVKTIGILYNSGEMNSVRIVALTSEACKAEGITLKEQTVTKTSDLPQAAAQLATKVDAIFISNDNTCLAGFKSILLAANAARKAVYCSDTDQVAQGALAALGPNQTEIGRQAGRLALRILKGEQPSALPVEFPSKTELFINEDVAKTLAIPLPDALKKEATRIISTPAIGAPAQTEHKG